MGAHFKIRRRSLFMSRMRVGSSGSYVQITNEGVLSQVGSASAALLTTSIGGGTSLSAILAGSATLATSSITAGSYENADITVTGLTTGHKVLISGNTSVCEVMAVGACATAANTLTVTYLNAGSATATGSSLTIHYLAVRDA